MELHPFPPEVVAAQQRYLSWVDTYGPFEWVQFNEEGDDDYVKASSVESALVWTEFHTGEHIEAVSGFVGPSGHWDLHGWYLASHPRETEAAVPESVIVEYSGPCWCLDSDTLSGNADCEDCEGQGFRYYAFD